jgi:ParB-like chromosome segregation protein Spo0J
MTNEKQIKMKKVNELTPYARNARTHSKQQVAQIAASIKEWGWTFPILIDEYGMVIAGHGRLEAARYMGVDEVPTITASGWSDAKKRAYILADNKLALNAGWDEDLIGIELDDLKESGYDLSLIGFDENELLGYTQSFSPEKFNESDSLDKKNNNKCPECGHEF